VTVGVFQETSPISSDHRGRDGKPPDVPSPRSARSPPALNACGEALNDTLYPLKARRALVVLRPLCSTTRSCWSAIASAIGLLKMSWPSAAEKPRCDLVSVISAAALAILSRPDNRSMMWSESAFAEKVTEVGSAATNSR